MTRIERLRRICLALPESSEKEAWGHPTFRIRDKVFCFSATDATTITVKADPFEREALIAAGDPFFVPSYVGNRGWVGITIGRATDWTEVAELVATSYCLIAPKRLAALVEP